MNRVWIGLAAICLTALLTVSPYNAAAFLAPIFAAQRTEPAWVAIPPNTRVFSATEFSAPRTALRAGRLDMFSTLSLPDLTSFYQQTLAARGFTVQHIGIGTITQAEAELIGTAGGLRATRTTDSASLIVSFANEEGLLRKSRLFNVNWSVGTR